LLSVGQWIGHANNIVNNNQKNTHQTLNNPGPGYDFFLVVVGCWPVWLLVVGLIIINNNIINNNQKRAYILAWVISLKVQVGCVQSHTHPGWLGEEKKRERGEQNKTKNKIYTSCVYVCACVCLFVGGLA